jgi:hypothetical protein
MSEEGFCMNEFFVYGPQCPNCLSDQGFIMCGQPMVTQNVSRAYLRARRTNDSKSVPLFAPEDDAGLNLLVGVPFECPRCTCKLCLNIVTDSIGRIIARLSIGGGRFDGVIAWWEE